MTYSSVGACRPKIGAPQAKNAYDGRGNRGGGVATKDVERRARAPTNYSAIWRGALAPSASEAPESVSSGAQGKA